MLAETSEAGPAAAQAPAAALQAPAASGESMSRRVSRERVDHMASFCANLREAVGSAQADVLAAKLPIASYGRVKDSFAKLEAHLTSAVVELVEIETFALKEASKAALQKQREEMEAACKAEVASKVGAVSEGRDQAVAAADGARTEAEARTREANERYEALVKRRDGAQDLVEAGEANLLACEEKLEKAIARGDKLEAKAVKFEGRITAAQEEWDNQLVEAMKGCTCVTRALTCDCTRYAHAWRLCVQRLCSIRFTSSGRWSTVATVALPCFSLALALHTTVTMAINAY